MWLEIIQEFNKNNKQLLDFKFELHLAIYNKELLKDKIKFVIEDDKLKIIMEEKELLIEEFFYWWQITRFDEIISDEEIIFNDFNKLKNKLSIAVKKLKDSEKKEENIKKKEEKIKKNEDKINKLGEHLKSEADKSNKDLDLLKNTRLMYPTYESLEYFLKNIKIILMNESK